MKAFGLLCALKVRIVDVLDDRFPRVQHMGVGHVVEEEEQIVGTVRQWFVEFLDCGWVLGDEAGSRGDGAIHADGLVIGAMPLSPAIVFGGLEERDRSDCL